MDDRVALALRAHQKSMEAKLKLIEALRGGYVRGEDFSCGRDQAVGSRSLVINSAEKVGRSLPKSGQREQATPRPFRAPDQGI